MTMVMMMVMTMTLMMTMTMTMMMPTSLSPILCQISGFTLLRLHDTLTHSIEHKLWKITIMMMTHHQMMMMTHGDYDDDTVIHSVEYWLWKWSGVTLLEGCDGWLATKMTRSCGGSEPSTEMSPSLASSLPLVFLLFSFEAGIKVFAEDNLGRQSWHSGAGDSAHGSKFFDEEPSRAGNSGYI